MAKAKAKTIPPCQVVCLDTGTKQNGSRSLEPRRRRVTSPHGGDYKIVIPPHTPYLLVGQHEIDAFAPLVESGHLSVLRIDSEHLDHVAEAALHEAVFEEVTKLKEEIIHLRQQLPEHRETVTAVGD